ncbi:MAG: hypothetical protein KF852_04185 [Saprospiraceae bacterium]|nr:hypothetical protein [Saprospiraceae bacterium]
MIVSIPPGGSGGGEVTELLAANTMQQTFGNIAANTTENIAAGAYRIRVYNAGLEDITVNGVTVFPGEYWTIEARENRSTTRFDLCPAVAVAVPVGGAASYQVERPSA